MVIVVEQSSTILKLPPGVYLNNPSNDSVDVIAMNVAALGGDNV